MNGQPVRRLLRLIAGGHGPVSPLDSDGRPHGSEFDDMFLSTPVGRAIATALDERELKEAAA